MSQILEVFSDLHLEPWCHVCGRKWWKTLHFVSEKFNMYVKDAGHSDTLLT